MYMYVCRCWSFQLNPSIHRSHPSSSRWWQMLIYLRTASKDVGGVLSLSLDCRVLHLWMRELIKVWYTQSPLDKYYWRCPEEDLSTWNPPGWVRGAVQPLWPRDETWMNERRRSKLYSYFYRRDWGGGGGQKTTRRDGHNVRSEEELNERQRAPHRMDGQKVLRNEVQDASKWISLPEELR